MRFMPGKRMLKAASSLGILIPLVFTGTAIADRSVDGPEDVSVSTLDVGQNPTEEDGSGQEAVAPEETPEAPGDTNVDPEPEGDEASPSGTEETIVEDELAPLGAEETSDTCVIPTGNYTGSIPTGKVTRLAGGDRYTTAVAVAQRVKSVAAGGETALFIASGRSFTDGLALGALAANNGWPLLLTNPSFLPASVAQYVASVKPTQIFIGGGTGAVNASVEEDLKSIVPDVEIHRFAGKDRYETSSLIAECYPKGTEAFVTTGNIFPDAMVATAPAVKNSGAVVLTPTNAANTHSINALRSLQPSTVHLIGGKWNATQKNRLVSGVDKSVTFKTASGKDRYATSVAVAKNYFGASPSRVLYAVGTNFPDALSGAAASALVNAPIVLTQTSCRPKTIEAISKTATTKVLLGGTGVVSTASYDKTCVPPPVQTKADLVVAAARAQHGKSYVWGATGPHSFDCSGLTQYAHRQAGINIPRSSYDQWALGRKVGSPRAGDIMIMRGGGHVGIYLSAGLIVDAGSPRSGVSIRPAPYGADAYVRYT